ncbi:MAG TPA: hypothetical protein VKU94_03840, partial [Geobacterales bacterium]|nr:hypothetical protein [Geobacterales bacterium]
SSLLAAIIGSFMATLLGLAYYGEGALSTALSFYDVIYLLPAYLAARFLKSRAILMAVCVILFTFILFLSVSTFLILYSFSLSVIFLISSFFYLRIKESNISAKRITMGIAVIVLIFSYIFFLTSPSSQYVLRSTFYALYPDSLNKAQWYQKNSSSECVQGNLAGDWTEEGGVYDPQRLRVIDTCVTVIGTIVGIFPSSGPASDNDFTLDLKLDPEYQYLLSLGSYWFKSGYLHIEVVPKDQSSVLGHLVLKPGMKIKVTGVWVLDTDHGWWSEIHPAWSIEILS